MDPIRRLLLAACAALCASVAAPFAVAQSPRPQVGVLERPAAGADAVPLAAAGLRAAGADVRDLHASALKGDLPLAKLDMVVVGGFYTSPEDAATGTLARKGAALRAFVQGGGLLFVFAQSYQRNELAGKLLPELKKPEERRPWAFLEPEYPLEWTPQQRDAVVVLDAAHPLTSEPTPIDAALIAAGRGEKDVATDSPLGVPGVRILVGHRYRLAFPWLSEAAVGRGRVVVCGGAPDLGVKARADGGLALVRALLGNAAAYADALRARTAPAFQPTFKDLPATTKEAVADFDDWAGFEKRVAAAVDRGVAALRKMQKEDGSFGKFSAPFGAENYATGQTCLGLLALLASGVSKSDDAVVRAAAALPTEAPRDTYQAGILAYALEHLAAPDGERFDLARLTPAERAKYVYKRNYPPARRKTAEDCARWLAEERYRGFWRYLENPRDADLSASQYATLGLLSAHRSGIKVPAEVFDKVIDGLLATQTKGKERVYAFPRRAPAPREWPEFEETRKPVGFWNYDAPVRAEWGRGTTDAIGIAMLAIALDGVSDGVRDARGARVAQAVDFALNHLDGIFRVDIQPSDPGRRVDRFPDFYWLYTLERAMTLTETLFVGRHDWYRETAEYLLDVQRSDGKWDVAGAQYRSDAIHTSFALLTLKRATLPGRVTPR